MKKLFIFFFLFFITLHANAQTGIFFQAIARDINTNPAKDRKIYVQSNIIQSSPTGTIVLIEEYQTYTDAFGIFNILVGSGTRVGGTVTGLSTIDWSIGPYYLNLKIVITPVGVGAGWDYTKEWVDIGTTIFGTVPFALYSANTANINEKLNVTDTTKMLEPYAKGKAVLVLSTTVDTKLATKDTAAMLAPYAKMYYNLDSNYLKKQIASLLGPSDTNTYTKQTYTDSALLKKMNVFDTSIYAKQAFVDAVNYTQQKFVETSLQSKFNLADTIKYTKKAYTDSALLTKLSNTGSAAGLTNFPILNQNTTGNAANAETAGNITATNNTTLTSLSNLNTVGTITNGVWNGTVIDIAHGGTGLSTAGRTGQVLTTATDGSLTWTSLTTQTATHSIGESFGGGIVFYVWDNGRHGLISATTNLSFGGTTVFTWGPTANYVMAIRNGINAGMSNTERIIMKQGAGIGNYAAMVAAHYSFNGNGWGDYGDWYLPSKYELQLLFKQKNVVGGFTNTTYVWSSTEADDKTAYTLNFFSTGGTVQAEPKNLNPRSVRAIRSF
jgi:hypothetical protein